jgi:hypothetical protein
MTFFCKNGSNSVFMYLCDIRAIFSPKFSHETINSWCQLLRNKIFLFCSLLPSGFTSFWAAGSKTINLKSFGSGLHTSFDQITRIENVRTQIYPDGRLGAS